MKYIYKPNIPGVKAELRSPFPIPQRKKQEFYRAALWAKKNGMAGRGGFDVERRRKQQQAKQQQGEYMSNAEYKQSLEDMVQRSMKNPEQELAKLRQEGKEFREKLGEFG